MTWPRISLLLVPLLSACFDSDLIVSEPGSGGAGGSSSSPCTGASCSGGAGSPGSSGKTGSSGGSGGPACSGSTCVECGKKCCQDERDTCQKDQSCLACASASPWDKSCSANHTYQALVDCVESHCDKTCVSGALASPPTQPPLTWGCETRRFGDKVCDCDCGGWDIDCDFVEFNNESNYEKGCGYPEICVRPSTCVSPSSEFPICDSLWFVTSTNDKKAGEDCAKCMSQQCCEAYKTCQDDICSQCNKSKSPPSFCANNSDYKELAECKKKCNASCN